MRSCFLFGVLFLVGACDQRVDEGGSLMTEGNQSIEVSFGGVTEIVHFDNLTTLTMYGDTPVVSARDIVVGSGLVASESVVDEIWLNFVGTDDYSPMANDNCESDYRPTLGKLADEVYIERGTCNTLWDESIAIEACMIVKEVRTIELAETEDGFDTGGDADSDTDSDTEPPPYSVEVHYEDDIQNVLLAEIDAASMDSIEVRLLSDIIEYTQMNIDLLNVALSFEGDDGYNPTEAGTCTEALPVSGEYADNGGLETITGDLYWETNLAFPGCAFVKRVAVIYVEDL